MSKRANTSCYLNNSWASLVAQTVKNLPAMQVTPVRSLGQEDHLKQGMAIHSRILAWRIPWSEEPGEPQSMELQRAMPGESHGQRSLAGYIPQDHKESDTTEATWHTRTQSQ